METNNLVDNNAMIYYPYTQEVSNLSEVENVFLTNENVLTTENTLKLDLPNFRDLFTKLDPNTEIVQFILEKLPEDVASIAGIKNHLPVSTQPDKANDTKLESSFTEENQNEREISSSKAKKKKLTYQKPHKCQYCSEAFNVLDNLLLHIVIHKNKPGRCPQCKKFFNRQASLNGHIQTHFKNEYFTCNICDELFPYEQLFLEHNEKAHANQSAQSQTKTKNDDWRVRKKQHSCKICKKSFSKPSELERHARIHSGEKPYQCDLCRQAFTQKNSLEIHKLKHTGIKPHQCPKCPLSFSQKCNLRCHLQRVHTSGILTKFPCSQCSCTFKKLGALNAHITRAHNTDNQRPNNSIEQSIADVMHQIAQMQCPDLSDQANVIATPKVKNDQQHKQQDQDKLIQIFPASMESLESSDGEKKKNNVLIQLADRFENGLVVHRVVKQIFINETRWLLCNFCSKKFVRPSDLLRHIRVHTKEKPYECFHCKRRFAIKSTLTVHMRIHDNNNKKYSCAICQKNFISLTSLDTHAKSHEGGFAFPCNQCDRTFQSKSQFCSHRKQHAKELNAAQQMTSSSSQIDPIPLQLTENGLVPISKKVVPIDDHVNRPHQCNICGASFKKLSHMREHNIKHFNIKPHQCNKCDKSFSRQYVLNIHSRTHTGAKPYKCSVCGCSFSTASGHKRHMQIHSEIKKFACSLCDKKFKSLETCRKHLKTHKNKFDQQEIDLPQNVEPLLLDQENFVSYSVFNDLPDSEGNKANQKLILANSEKEVILQETSVTNPSNNLPHTFILILDDHNFDPLKANKEFNTQLITRNDESDIFNDSNIVHQLNESNLESQEIVSNSLSLNDHPTNLRLEDLNSLNIPILTNESFEKLTENNEMILINSVLNESGDQHMSNSFPNTVDSQDNNTFIVLSPSSSKGDFSDGTSTYFSWTPKKRSLEAIKTPAEESVTIQQERPKTEMYLKNLEPRNTENFTSSNVIIQNKNLNLELSEGKSARNNPINNKTPSDIEKPKGTFKKCDFCSKKFIRPIDLKRHIRTHTGEKPYKCDSCEKSFSLLCTLQRHKEIHTETSQRRNFKCHVCCRTYTSKGSLDLHMRIHTGERPFNCLYCNHNFRTSGHLKVHIQAHIKEAKRKGVHPKETKTRSNQINHVVATLNERLSTIAETSELLPSLSEGTTLQTFEVVDMRSLSKCKSKLFICTVCRKSFKKLSLLERHELIHTNEKPFECNICRKSFSQKAVLKTHTLIHTGEKPFSCEKCSKTFSNKSRLLSHIKSC